MLAEEPFSTLSLALPLLLDLFLYCLAPPAAAEKINQDLHMLAYILYIEGEEEEVSRGISPPCLLLLYNLFRYKI